ncbi:uncharacterized protein LOC144768971 [Lissotriton helveticus]
MELFLTPASVKSAPSRFQKKYRPPDSHPAFLRADPVPDSVIVTAAKKQHSTAPSSMVPPDKESRQVDSAGRKVYSTAATSMKATRSSGHFGSPEAQQRIANLPFSGSTLFGVHADEQMARMKVEVETLKAVARHLRERYGDNPFDDKKDIMALLLPKETQSTEGTDAALQKQEHEPKASEAAGSKLHGHEITAERESDFQEPELRSQGVAGTRTDQQEPEDAEGTVNNMQEPRQATGDTTSTNLQELLHGREDSMGTSVKGARQLAGTGDALQDPVCGCEEGAGLYPQTPVRRGVDMEGQVHRSRQTPQEPVQGGHRNSHSTVLRMKQGCFCIPSCLK